MTQIRPRQTMKLAESGDGAGEDLPVEQAAVDRKRQAHGVLAAFRFQLMQTSLAWIGVAPGHTILVEHIEDFDVQSDDLTISTQAKYSGQDKAVTLASRDSGKALCRFWDQNGRSTGVSLVYQTNLQAGHERDIALPDGVTGIDYWEAVKRGAPVQPLRDALVRVLPDSALKTWLEGAPADENIRANLIRRVVWSVGLAAGPALSAMLAEQLAGRLAALSLPPGLAGVLTNQLSEHVFELASDPNPDVRRLDSDALNRFLAERALGAAGASHGWVLPTWAICRRRWREATPCGSTAAADVERQRWHGKLQHARLHRGSWSNSVISHNLRTSC
jgi:hypothetical protein